jgi:hypothetical protein
VAQEFVVALDLVALDADDGAVIADAYQEITAFGVQERGDRLGAGRTRWLPRRSARKSQGS